MHVIPQSCLVMAGLSLLVEIADKHTHTHTFAGFFKKEASSLSLTRSLSLAHKGYTLSRKHPPTGQQTSMLTRTSPLLQHRRLQRLQSSCSTDLRRSPTKKSSDSRWKSQELRPFLWHETTGPGETKLPYMVVWRWPFSTRPTAQNSKHTDKTAIHRRPSGDVTNESGQSFQ